MAAKTISLQEEAYERLRAAKRDSSESFTQVVLRATWAAETMTGRALLARLREGPLLTEKELDAIESHP